MNQRARPTASTAVSNSPGGPDAAGRWCLDYVDYASYRAAGGHQLLQECTGGRRDAASVVRVLAESGLCDVAGLADRAARVIVGDTTPGGFRDRLLLERDPQRFLEGLLIVCWAAGIDTVTVQLDGGSEGCTEILRHELATLVQELPIAGLTPIELSSGRSRSGVAATPLEVEPLCWVRALLEPGGDGFAAAGLRWYAVAGRVNDPGLKLAPVGIGVRALIDTHCGGMPAGQRLYAYLPAGAVGGILPATLDRQALAPAAVLVLSDQDSAVGAARELLRRFCRNDPGSRATTQLATLIERPQWDRALLAELAMLARATPFATAALRAIDSITRHFRPEVE